MRLTAMDDYLSLGDYQVRSRHEVGQLFLGLTTGLALALVLWAALAAAAWMILG